MSVIRGMLCNYFLFTNMRKIFLSAWSFLFLVLCLLFVLFVRGGYSVIQSMQQQLFFLQEIEPNIISIFQQDQDIMQLNKGGFLLKNMDLCLIDTANLSEVCNTKIPVYSEILKKIPDNQVFYRCEGSFLVKQISSFHYEVYISNDKNPTRPKKWLSYDYPFSIHENIDPCYPWNHLEKYWLTN